MKSPENGTAELKARHPLNCENRSRYVLTIAAVACNGQVSQRYMAGKVFSCKNKAKCLLDAVETPLSLLHCHTLCFIGLHHVVKLELESSRMFYCNKD